MTTDPRNDILSLLADALRLAPDVRVGQLVAFLGDMGQIDTGRTLADLDDGELLAVLRQHVADLSGQTPAVACP